MLDLYKFKDDITRSSLHSFISHIGVSQVRVAGSTRLDFEGELFHSWDDFLRVAEMAFLSDHLAFSLTSGT